MSQKLQTELQSFSSEVPDIIDLTWRIPTWQNIKSDCPQLTEHSTSFVKKRTTEQKENICATPDDRRKVKVHWAQRLFKTQNIFSSLKMRPIYQHYGTHLQQSGKWLFWRVPLLRAIWSSLGPPKFKPKRDSGPKSTARWSLAPDSQPPTSV